MYCGKLLKCGLSNGCHGCIRTDTIWWFPQIRAIVLGVPIIGIIVYWGLPILGNYHMSLAASLRERNPIGRRIRCFISLRVKVALQMYETPSAKMHSLEAMGHSPRTTCKPHPRSTVIWQYKGRPSAFWRFTKRSQGYIMGITLTSCRDCMRWSC